MVKEQDFSIDNHCNHLIDIDKVIEPDKSTGS
jgi:hypothetical protein